METRASYVAVGSFVLILMVGLVVFAVWLGGSGLRENAERYLIYFSGNVTGLQEGSQVRYRGIPVGTVEDVQIDPSNVEQVQVLIAVRPKTPIVKGTVASLEIQGLTGGAFILLSGGVQGAPPLEKTEGHEYAVIPSRQSGLQAIVDTVPQLLDRLSEISREVQRIFSEDNRRNISEILANVNTLSAALALRSTQLATTIERIDSLTQNVDGLVTQARTDLDRLSTNADGFLSTTNTQVNAAVADVRAMIASLRQSADGVARLLRQSGPGVESFSTDGLYEITQLITQLRQLTDNLNRTLSRLDRSPAQFLFGGSSGGVPPEGSSR
ncbi:MlaD family protein [Inquilinus limosus]|uniref:MlaD family protein n=1 Tax=Inquilinus limosus TaxID=171674 RepID=UPI0003F64273|nr:MlaD family protein [Inquilinus limosus]